jgi:hypothetical protein
MTRDSWNIFGPYAGEKSGPGFLIRSSGFPQKFGTSNYRNPISSFVQKIFGFSTPMLKKTPTW